MAAARQEPNSGGERNSIRLGPADRLEGRLYIEGDVMVAGTVEGALEVTGDVEIDGGGKVSGPVTARHRLVVGSHGSLRGDVRVSRLIVQDGATVSGNVAMVKPQEVSQPPKAESAAPVPEVATNGAGAKHDGVEATQPAPAPSKPDSRGRRR